MASSTTAGLQEPTWVSVVKGIVFILFGIMAIGWPGITLVNLAWLFAIYILVVGVFDLVAGVMSAGKQDWWWLKIVIGVLAIGVGIYLLRAGYVVDLATFIFVVGFTFIFRSILEMVLAFTPGVDGSARALMIIAGVIGLIAGFLILRHPISGGLAFTWLLGVYALVSGPIIIGMAMKNR